VKKCFKCLATKPIDDFYKHPAMSDGHLNKCKECAKTDAKVGKVPRNCLTCGKDFMAVATEIKRGGGKTCSRECYYERLKVLLSDKYSVKTSYQALHKWVAKELGKPNKCSLCEDTTKNHYEWANVSGEYKQDTTDWIRLCKKCHHKYDRISEKLWYKRKKGVNSPLNVAVGIKI
jgi:hypothetical protein